MNVLKNFIRTLRHFKLASALNIFGLSVAFAAFMVIMMQVSYEYGFEKDTPNSERTYRVEYSWDKVEFSPIIARPRAEMLVEGVSGIENYTLTMPFLSDRFITFEQNGTDVGFKDACVGVYPAFANVFGLEFLSGTAKAFEEPNSVILPSSLAKKYFGTNDCFGKTIRIEGSDKSTNIAGVYKDFPANSSQSNVIYGNMGDENKDQWGNSNYYFYVTLTPGADLQAVVAAINTNGAQEKSWKGAVRLTPMQDIYFSESLNFEMLPHGNRTTTNILIAIAFVVIVIAFINFVNFSTSLTPLRIKSINIQKVLGSFDSTLRWRMVLESFVFSIVSLLIAFLWVNLLGYIGFSQYLLTEISITTYPVVAIATIGVAVIAGFVAGIYPAFYSTAFSPALVLKGSFGLTPKGKVLRTTLIGIQFVISIALIMAAISMQLQNSYLRQFKGGINTDQVAIIELSNEMSQSDKKPLIISRLKESSMIKDVAFSMFMIGAGDTYMTWGRDYKDGNINFTCLPVSWNFPEVMGLEIVEGRSFMESDGQIRGGRVIFNQTAQKQFELSNNETFTGHTDTIAQIVGFVKDFNFKSLRFGIEPMALYLFDDQTAWRSLNIAYIKISGDPYAAADHIKKVIKEIDPSYPIEINFYDTIFNNLYHKENNTAMQITAFSLLAVVISLLGVFGIVVFETQFRRKEIGIRKVHGSTVTEILYMFNKQYLIITVICALIATPLAYLGVNSWLESFEYRIDLSWTIFVGSTLIVMFITFITVTFQAYKAAVVNPVKSIKSE